MSSGERTAAWKDIWIKKGQDPHAAPHVADGYDLLSAEAFDHMVEQVARPLGLRGGEHILECGCGAGAFLASLRKLHPGLKLSGVDYAPTLLARARERLDGEFFCADITDLGFLAPASYDHTISFGVVLYLSSEEEARRAIAEMLRVTRPGGTVLIGEVSDAAKRELAEAIRGTSHDRVEKVSATTPDHLYLDKELFRDVARSAGAALQTIDHSELELGSYEAARYRYSVYLTKPAER